MVNKIRGKNARNIMMLKTGNTYHTERHEIAEKLAEIFASISSEENYVQRFVPFKIATE